MYMNFKVSENSNGFVINNFKRNKTPLKYLDTLMHVSVPARLRNARVGFFWILQSLANLS